MPSKDDTSANHRVVSQYLAADCPEAVRSSVHAVVQALSQVEPYVNGVLLRKEEIVRNAVMSARRTVGERDPTTRGIFPELRARDVLNGLTVDDRIDLLVRLADDSTKWNIVVEFDANRADQVTKKFVSRAALLRGGNLIYIACCYPRKAHRHSPENSKFIGYLRLLAEPLGLKGFIGIVLSQSVASTVPN